ncbi:ImpL2 family protein [Megaselia abdita]
MKKMNALMILAVLIFGLALPHPGYCRPLIEEEDDMDNAIEPDSSRKNEVQDWVKITKAPPQKYVQKLGESIEVECEIMGSPAPFVEWFEGRYPPDNEFESNLIMEGSPSAIVRAKKVLKIDYQIEYERTFTCRGRSGSKQVFSTTTVYPSPELKQRSAYTEMYQAQLNHQSRLSANKPKIIYSHPLHIDVVGSNIVLPCHVVGTPRPQIQWVNSDGYIREENPRYKVLPNGDLLISSIKWEDMGAYKCIAKNSHGKDSADAFIYPALKE